ncbi:MAG: GNAT family N-acetyltransferase [Candidatus Marinarcus sp.]|uniref:GNAT family N-acetyltransferase n=1 Tax=Candidatus Marinarcus sp. TaxID=3100987 RepID=UPI003B0045F7
MILKNNLQICEASYKDIPFLITLLKQLFCIEKDFIFNAQKHEEGLKLLIDNKESIVAVAKFEDEVIAMLTMQTIISTAIGAKAGLLEDFVVSDDYKSMGVGSHLLEFMKDKALQHNIHRLQLVCDNDNANAKEFYTKKDFKKSNLSAWYLLRE